MQARYKVAVTLEPSNRMQAEEAMIQRGLDVPSPFFGPVFEEVQDYEIYSEGVHIRTAEGPVYFYPMRTVVHVKSEPI